MTSKEQILFDYLQDDNGGIYQTGYVTHVRTHGGIVECTEYSQDREYMEKHLIDCFDLIVWLYEKGR